MKKINKNNLKFQGVKTKLFKNAIAPKDINEALTIAATKGITLEYIKEYFEAKPKEFQVLHVFCKPYAFKITL